MIKTTTIIITINNSNNNDDDDVIIIIIIIIIIIVIIIITIKIVNSSKVVVHKPGYSGLLKKKSHDISRFPMITFMKISWHFLNFSPLGNLDFGLVKG